MTQDKTFKWKCRRWLGAGALLVACGLGMVSCNGYDLDENVPEGWGQSIYDYMAEQGSYSNMTRLVDDLNYRNVLAQTGSVTLFAADDEAFQRFYAGNSWGVKRYEDLTEAQKKMLLFGAMIKNSLQVQSLSSTMGPIEGECMRRLSAMSIYDTIPVLTKEQMPNNPFWKRYRDEGKIVCMEDMSITPMMHLIEKHLQNNQITDDDVNFLYNYKITRKPGDASVNGKQIVEPNIRCSNGFIHRVGDVVVPLPNMARVIANNPNTTIYNKLLQRFCAPYDCGEEVSRNYFGPTYNRTTDTVFQKRFFSEKSQEGKMLDYAPDNLTPINGLLKFDPGWNAYYMGGGDPDVALQRDMAVMMVPTDSAMNAYWKNEGKMLSDVYDSWDDVPDNVIVRLLNNNMLPSFLLAVPSKMNNILNDANDPMGVEKGKVSSVEFACNGAVYYTKKVYTPTSYVSVCYPTVVNETMKIMDWAIRQLQYNAYLNSLNSTYSFFIPTNKAMLEYIDPVSYGQKKTKLFRFHYDPKATSENEKVKAGIWDYDVESGTIVSKDSVKANFDQIKNRLKDVLESHIVIGNLDNEHHFYRTKKGTEIYIDNLADGENGMTVCGGWQYQRNEPLKVTKIYDQSGPGNGKAYILDGAPIMGTNKSVSKILGEHPEFALFKKYLDASKLTENEHNGNVTAGENISLFNTYHYTVYVPSESAIKELQKKNILPAFIEGEDMRDPATKESDSLKIVNFIKMHIQDNALYINSQYKDMEYETSYLINNGKQFSRLSVSKEIKDGRETIAIRDGSKDADGKEVVRYVVTSNPALYNIPATEYQFSTSGGDAEKAGGIATSSSAVVHLIDGALQIPNK